MKNEDFHPSAPGRLVPIQGAEACAFVPAPLPTELPMDAKSIGLLALAENALGRLSGTTAREFNPFLVGSPLLHREAILSSRIEGTITTPEKLVLADAGGEPSANREIDENTREVANYMQAMRHGLTRLPQLPVCLRLMREIHEVLLRGVRGERERPGEFRTHQNWVRGRLDDSLTNARYVPPPVAEMGGALESLESYINQSLSEESTPLLVRCALIHYQFEVIHPFRDGNGRVGRLLIPLLLCGGGRLDAPIFYLSSYFEKNRDLYMDLLLNVSQTGDFNSWVKFFLLGVAESAQEATQQATDLLALRRDYHRTFQKGRSSALLIRLVDHLFQSPSITISDAAAILGVSSQAASNNIGKLVDEGILREVTGRSRGRRFIAQPIVNFMSDSPSATEPDQE